ncbi:uncharacterized protein LOC127157483 [Labeo rohita]|uniref:uncharacterized protein LOC127157483 n=1 Tax=Labeo rohita TaxID=84645 RepID=UPI0021E2EA23|nr:uncharacterized protein LOC127157483 [Labeo rohita]XP_050956703.1 uncharacterized protein LOC127157483 [Labeo rohita]XP_050956704.1 uncharacterized protein LOC127157483 [Labeo rohita]
MNAVNAVHLFIMVWTFTAVCQANDDGCSVKCQNVTGFVGNEATFKCSVSLQRTECCIKLYKFQYPKGYDESAICKEGNLVNYCDHSYSFTCRYTPTTAMTEKFRFFVQTLCGMKTAEFPVDITEPVKREIVTEAPEKKEEPVWVIPETSEQKKAEGRGFKIAVIAAVISCFIIVIMPAIYKIKQKRTRQNRTFQVIRQEGGNSSHPDM